MQALALSALMTLWPTVQDQLNLLPREDPAILRLRSAFAQAHAPTLTELAPGAMWWCRDFLVLGEEGQIGGPFAMFRFERVGPDLFNRAKNPQGGVRGRVELYAQGKAEWHGTPEYQSNPDSLPIPPETRRFYLEALRADAQGNLVGEWSVAQPPRAIVCDEGVNDHECASNEAYDAGWRSSYASRSLPALAEPSHVVMTYQFCPVSERRPQSQ